MHAVLPARKEHVNKYLTFKTNKSKVFKSISITEISLFLLISFLCMPHIS